MPKLAQPTSAAIVSPLRFVASQSVIQSSGLLGSLRIRLRLPLRRPQRRIVRESLNTNPQLTERHTVAVQLGKIPATPKERALDGILVLDESADEG
jgi:hypothetical protein